MIVLLFTQTLIVSMSFPTGVPHDGELPYVWGYPLLKQNKDVRRQSGMLLDIIHWNEEDKDYTNFIQTVWTNFAKTGYEIVQFFLSY